MNLKQYLLARLAEPSTWRGIVLLVTAAGVTVSPELQAAIVTFGIGLAGLLGVALPDAK